MTRRLFSSKADGCQHGGGEHHTIAADFFVPGINDQVRIGTAAGGASTPGMPTRQTSRWDT